MSANVLRPLMGLVAILAAVGVVAVAVVLFQGGLTDSVEVRVLSPRAGLVMNPDAKVKMHGVTVGKVASIEELPDGQAQLRLAMNPDELHKIPSDVVVDIAASTVFGAKYVELVPPVSPSAERMHAGQVFDAQQVTVEVNTVFEQLTSVLGSIEPEKLNETLGAIAVATRGRGDQFGQMLSDLDALLVKLDPSLPALRRDIDMAQSVVDTYAQTSPDLLATVDHASSLSDTLVDQQQNLDAVLVSVIGLSDVGTPVLEENHAPLANALDLLVPTLSLTNEYAPALTCGIQTLAKLHSGAVVGENGVGLSASFLWGVNPYKYPENLPKVAASGGPHCMGAPNLPYETYPPFLVADVGANPWADNSNTTVQLNAGNLTQLLFGGVPRYAPPAAGGPR
ncbi:MCE family protein [Aldersonia kunmingensis]|uniref:MCE family protein n=1 Tax=Aldersonia kunmingensis TaxID=408066 RepID=UPI000A619DF1|nr:MCE family protein [Aldersonia kunmingensis]